MKKVLSLLTIVAFSATLAASAAETKASSFLNKLSQKEQEINRKIEDAKIKESEFYGFL